MENRGTYYVYYGWGGEKNAFKLASDKKGIKYALERLNKDRSIEWKEGLRQYAWLLHVSKDSKRRLLGIYENFHERHLFMRCYHCNLIQAHPPSHLPLCARCSSRLETNNVVERTHTYFRWKDNMFLHFGGGMFPLMYGSLKTVSDQARWLMEWYMRPFQVSVTGGYLISYYQNELLEAILQTDGARLICPECKTQFPMMIGNYKCPWCGHNWYFDCKDEGRPNFVTTWPWPQGM
ncbi:MAG TPA: hypothetical protein PKI14_16360 [Fervidobacterium sp.]|nr:hypothetical protein [Fervidobacterium sp.]